VLQPLISNVQVSPSSLPISLSIYPPLSLFIHSGTEGGGRRGGGCGGIECAERGCGLTLSLSIYTAVPRGGGDAAEAAAAVSDGTDAGCASAAAASSALSVAAG